MTHMKRASSDEEWTGFLRRHLAFHPSATAQDLYKLLHQACYGPGHIISDEASARRYLEEEWEATGEDRSQMLWEPVEPTGAVARLHLGAAKAKAFSVQEVGDIFLASADEFASVDDFRSVWALARALVPGDPDIGGLDGLAAMAQPPPVRHSAHFAKAESPHYRVALVSMIRQVEESHLDD